jgi:hypothetical protein
MYCSMHGRMNIHQRRIVSFFSARKNEEEFGFKVHCVPWAYASSVIFQCQKERRRVRVQGTIKQHIMRARCVIVGNTKNLHHVKPQIDICSYKGVA